MTKERREERPTPPPPQLHELEAEVMEEVWARGEATVREVLDALNEGSKRRAYTTVMTVMARLDRKGLLTRRRQGRMDVYSPLIERRAYMDARASAEVSALVDEFGDVALAHFARRMDGLDAERIRKLRSLAHGD
ncbi:MAG TPA: BlaI/MecI/CopY family transcriptional regulator [Thermoleophilaceae bacterium]|nr:BlaI/MecI/CopY family transcriptional regulator [Thermoleophilaceae bacterium]